MKRIGVTGAFGFLGANFVRSLLETDEVPSASRGEARIVAFASRSRSNPVLEEPGIRSRFRERVEVEDLDVLDRDGMARKFEGLDAVAHFAGVVDYRESMKRRVWDIDALGAKAVFDAALAAGVSKVLYVSSICVLGSGLRASAPAEAKAGAGASGRRVCDERSLPYGDPSWPLSFASAEEALAAVEASLAGDYRFLRRSRVAYIDAKVAGWEIAKLYARERSLPVVTVFPGTVVGAGDLHREMSRLVDGVWEGKVRVSLSGLSSFVAVRDFARGAVLALERGRVGEGYVLSGREEHNLSYVDFQDLIGSVARTELWFARRKPLALPRGLLLPVAALAERLIPGAGMTKALVLSGSLRNYPCVSDKARAELGYEPSASLEPAIVECRRFSEAGRAAAGKPRSLPFVQRLLPQLSRGARG
jgi:dihydroflavonol-4-reductase